MADIQIRSGINYVTFASKLTAAMSTYNNSLCFIESQTPEGKLFPDATTEALGYSYNPVEPLFSSIRNFENTKTYYIQARQAFSLDFPGLSSKQYQWFTVLPGKVVTPQGGGQPYFASYKYNIGFDRSILRTPISACISPVGNRKYFVVSTRTPNDSNTTPFYFGLLDEPGQPGNTAPDYLTHFEPGSAYSVFVIEGVTTNTMLSVARVDGSSYLLTDDLRFLTTESGDYIKV